MPNLVIFFFFFFNDTATTEIYTLSLHDALPICESEVMDAIGGVLCRCTGYRKIITAVLRSEEHTSELQSQSNLVCRLLLEKKKKKQKNISSDRGEVVMLLEMCNKQMQS